MKIAVHTHYTNSYEPLASIIIPNLQWYCDKHGYDFHIEKYEDGNVDFVKTKTALNLLEKYDLVFCLEADILVTNHTKKIEDFIDDKHSFFICNDVNGINGGSFIAKSDELGKRWLSDTNKFEGKYKTEQNFWENITHPLVGILQHPSINSIPYKYYHNYGYINYNGQSEPTHEMGNWEKGDFVCHLPGKTLLERIKIFTEIKEQIVYE